MARYVGLVAASKRRRGGIHPASEQFGLSPVFRRAREYCDRMFGEWYILSTTHLLLPPHQVVGAREPALHMLSAPGRNRWAEAVAEQLCERRHRSGEPITYVLFASQFYAGLLARAAPDVTVEYPLAGLSLSQRLHWYDERLRIQPRVLPRAGA